MDEEGRSNDEQTTVLGGSLGRALSLLVTLAMVLGMCPIWAIAEEVDVEPDDEVVVEVQGDVEGDAVDEEQGEDEEDVAGAQGTDGTDEPVVLAEELETQAAAKTIACLGTSGIAAPTAPQQETDPWSGSYVYYGQYGAESDREPVKYRVLAPSTNDFGGTTMLLDCDSILTAMMFDDDSNVWKTSTVNNWLNGDKFLSNSNFFTAQEQAAIAPSTKAAAAEGDGQGANYLSYTKLAGEKVFLLDAVEATRTTYGYGADAVSTDKMVNRQKQGAANVSWWLRSADADGTGNAGYVNYYGDLNKSSVLLDSGVSPAFNVNLNPVIFSSEIKYNTYKLTLADKDAEGNALLTIKADPATVSGTTVTIPYSIGGKDKVDTTQASYVVLEKEWDAAQNKVLAYGELEPAGEGKGTFDLTKAQVGEKDVWGEDYFVYVLAENVNGAEATDYASKPAKVGKPSEPQPATHKVTVATEPAEGGTAKASAGEAAAGESVTLTATAKDNYEFAGWTVTGEGAKIDDASKAEAKLTMGTADVTAIATFKKETPKPEPEPAKVARPSTSGHPGTGEIDVSWKAAKGAKAYEVQWRKKGGKWQKKAATSLECTISGLKKGTLYEIRVRAKADSVAGAWSPVARRWLRGPSSVKAKAGSTSGSIKVSWKRDKKATGGTKVYVYAKKGGKLVKTATAKAGKASATVSGLKAGKRYYVRVRPIRTSSNKTYTGTLCSYKSVRASK